MTDFKPGDKVQIKQSAYGIVEHLRGRVSTIDGPAPEYDFKLKNGIHVNADEIELVSKPNQDWVTVDANGEVQLPEWVKPGYYKRTDNPDGSILLEPLMTKAEWEALK